MGKQRQPVRWGDTGTRRVPEPNVVSGKLPGEVTAAVKGGGETLGALSLTLLLPTGGSHWGPSLTPESSPEGRTGPEDVKASSSIQSRLKGTCIVGETRGLLSFPESIKGISPTPLPPPGPYTPGEDPQAEAVGQQRGWSRGVAGARPERSGTYSSILEGWGLLDPHGCSLGGLGRAAVPENPGAFSWSPCSVWPLKSSGASEFLNPLRAGLKWLPPNSG